MNISSHKRFKNSPLAGKAFKSPVIKRNLPPSSESTEDTSHDNGAVNSNNKKILEDNSELDPGNDSDCTTPKRKICKEKFSYKSLASISSKQSSSNQLNNSLSLPSHSENDTPAEKHENVISQCSSTTPKVIKRKHSTFKSPVMLINKKEESVEDLLIKEKELDDVILQLKEEGIDDSILSTYYDKLHEYNEVKDAAQIIMGRLAELQQLSVKELHAQYDAPGEI